ncbi:MAG: AAA family ATPase [Clostridia bacterium]|nr:AAA family ATPase [Clostridia bacterium]
MITDTEIEISAIEEELSKLPQGSVVKKTVKGKDYYYRRIKSGGKYVEIAIEPDSLTSTKNDVARRKQLEKRLKELNALADIQSEGAKYREAPPRYRMDVITGERLADKTKRFGSFKRRECFEQIKSYVYGDSYEKVFILYGLRRTGKSTLMCQIIADMDEEHFAKCAYISTRNGDSLAVLDDDMDNLYQRGYRYVFIDEATFMSDFIEGAALLSDVYAGYGMKIVLSGTDSLGFRIAQQDQLYDRCFMAHTTFIPYREFECVLGIKGIDEYIRYGGTMSPSGIFYNVESATSAPLGSYVNTAIAKNIQNSLKNYQQEGHFRHLWGLYQKDELTSAINRVVEDMNHHFTVNVLTREFKSNDLASSASILRKDKSNPNRRALDNIDIISFTENLRKMLDILNLSEQTVTISEIEAEEIKQYLSLLDLIYDIPVVDCAHWGKEDPIIAISQPGLRYAQAETLIKSLLKDPTFAALDLTVRKSIQDLILNEISGRMMEEIVLLETKLAMTNKNVDVFKLKFEIGEFDMVVADNDTNTCEIFEIKHSDKIVSDQYKYLSDAEKCSTTKRLYGDIAAKYVLYRGDTADVEGIRYVNVEEYLKSL